MEIKNVFDRLISRLETTEERISEIEGRSTEITQPEMLKKKKKRKWREKNRTLHLKKYIIE